MQSIGINSHKSRHAIDVGVLLRINEPNDKERINNHKKGSYSEAERKAKREWAARNREHIKANFESWYDKNKEALSVKRKAQRDALKAQ